MTDGIPLDEGAQGSSDSVRHCGMRNVRRLGRVVVREVDRRCRGWTEGATGADISSWRWRGVAEKGKCDGGSLRGAGGREAGGGR